MTQTKGRHPHLSRSPKYRKIEQWPAMNPSCYQRFRTWLAESGYGASVMNEYSVVARLIFSLIDKPYLQIDPEADLDRVHTYIDEHYDRALTRRGYHKAVRKFKQFLYRCLQRQPHPKPLNWALFTGTLPAWMVESIRDYLVYRRRSWLPENQHKRSIGLLSQLTSFLRWLSEQNLQVSRPNELTPKRWYAYLDARLAQEGKPGVSPVSLNIELSEVHSWLQWLSEQGHSVHPRMLAMEALPAPRAIPRDLPVAQLQKLQQTIQVNNQSARLGGQRGALMDLAWFLLMLHSGLRLNEIRRLKLKDLDWERHLIRIEQSKGLNDRLVPVSQMALDALKRYLVVRGPDKDLPDNVFIHRHAVFSMSYCGARLKTYGAQCGVKVTPHQLRHSCATLLLNSGAPIATVRMILGHVHVDTTLRYARSYDGTIAADYVRAMASIELSLPLFAGNEASPMPSYAQVIAMLDGLRLQGTLNQQQLETLKVMRLMLLRFGESAGRDPTNCHS